MNERTKGKDANSIIPKGYIDPFKTNTYIDPFKASKDYKDPLSVPKEEYVDPIKAKPFKMPEYHEYKLPDLDPLTGKPYRKGGRRTTKKEEPKKTSGITPKSYFPTKFGNTVGSTKRMLKILENLDF